MEETKFEHIPVLADVLAEQIILPLDGVMVDATIGQGGHSYLFGQGLNESGILIGIDFDEKSIKQAEARLGNLKCRLILKVGNFSEIKQIIEEAGVERVDFILADLGFSSFQIEDPRKGLSFSADMPLDMRMDKRLKVSAADIVNKTEEKQLADLIYKYGEERASRRIARFIVRHREKRRIEMTGELAEVVSRALHRKGVKGYRRIHPATRTFQALRIAVNNELENLDALLESAPDALKSGGRIAVISFHSLEDRKVKQNFIKNKEAGVYKILTKRPITASEAEKEANRRSRSAKLRIAEKL